MNKIKIVLVVISFILIGGCSSIPKGKKLYENLDAIDTYTKACDYYSENVTHEKNQMIVYNMVQNQITEDGMIYGDGAIEQKCITETIWGDNFEDVYCYQTYIPIKNPVVFEQPLSCWLSFYSDKNKYTLSAFSDGILNDATQEYFKDNKYHINNKNHVPFFTRLTDEKCYSIKNSEREDLKESILITLQVEYSGENGKQFYKYSFVINNEDGLIHNITTERYKDSNFTNLLTKTESTNIEFNKKKELDLENVINDFKKYEGRQSSEVNFLFDFRKDE